MSVPNNLTGYKITFPKIPPYKAIGDYCHSKKGNRDHIQKYEWDKPGHDPVFHLTAAQRRLEIVTDDLQRKREWMMGEREKLQKQWQDLEDKEKRFQDTFKRMNGFIRSNEEKRVRAANICKEDKALRVRWCEMIEDLQQKMDNLVAMRAQMDENIASLMMYPQYLHSTATASNEFKNAEAIIDRYDALVNTKNILAARQLDNLKELESIKTKTTKMAEDYRFRIIGLNNKVADLNSRYNTAFREALHWENIVLAIKRRSYQLYGELNEVKQSIWNMYLIMCKRKNETPKIPEEDFEKQLVYVKKTLLEIQIVKKLVVLGNKEGSNKPKRKA